MHGIVDDRTALFRISTIHRCGVCPARSLQRKRSLLGVGGLVHKKSLHIAFHRKLQQYICPRRLGTRSTTESNQQDRIGNDNHRSETPSTCEIRMNFSHLQPNDDSQIPMSTCACALTTTPAGPTPGMTPGVGASGTQRPVVVVFGCCPFFVVVVVEWCCNILKE